MNHTGCGSEPWAFGLQKWFLINSDFLRSHQPTQKCFKRKIYGVPCHIYGKNAVFFMRINGRHFWWVFVPGIVVFSLNTCFYSMDALDHITDHVSLLSVYIQIWSSLEPVYRPSQPAKLKFHPYHLHLLFFSLNFCSYIPTVLLSLYCM